MRSTATDLTTPLALGADGRPVRPAPRRPGPLATLRTRTVLVTCATALVSVLVTAVIAFPIAVRAAQRQAARALAEEVMVVAEVVGSRVNVAGQERVVRLLRRQGIDVYVIRAGRPDRTGLPAGVVDTIAAGGAVSQRTALVNGVLSFVEGRPLQVPGDGVVLVERVLPGGARQVWRQLWLPLLAGLIAGVLAGALLARLLASPIRNAATAAARLSAGDRSVRLPVKPPAEVEELSLAMNNLAEALATSENRQRDFLLSISHELRTPLTTLRGYAEAIADGVITADAAPEAARTMLGQAQHLDRLVADLLALARLEAVDFPLEWLPVDLTALAVEAARAWTPRFASAGVTAHTELAAGPVVVTGDPGRIRQVIDGLLENALRVVPAGAPVILAVRARDPAYPWLAVIEIRDGGPGFTDDDLAVAFDRGALYQRYRGIRRVGSGLGLALAAGLVRRMGGAIEAGHAPEGGARFTVRFPYQVRTQR